MAVAQNGSNFINPLVTIQESINTRALNAEIFEVNTTYEWLDSAFDQAGTYALVCSVGTVTVFAYGTDNALLAEIAVTTTSGNTTIASAIGRWTAQASEATDLTINKVNPKITADGGTITLDRLSSGNYATSSGTAGNYSPGQYAHVVVVGGGGGGGGLGGWSGVGQGGSGGVGGVAHNNTAIALTGTYSLTAGAGGVIGNNGSSPGPGGVGGTGGTSTGFSLTADGGVGGSGGSDNVPATTGAAGTPTGDPATQIYNPATRTKLIAGRGGQGGRGNPTFIQVTAGEAGKILVLKWTP